MQRARLSIAPAVLLALIVVGCNSQTTEHVLNGRAPADAGKTPSVQAAFDRESYAPGNRAVLRIFNRARSVRLQILQSGPEFVRTTDEMTMNGIGVTRPVTVGGVRRGRKVSVRIGPWPSGLYFARLTAPDGRIGFAPFVVRPSRLGRHRAAVVMPTLTWQAYNLRDGNRDGIGDSWYACPGKRAKDCPTGNAVRLGRPFLNRGVPSRFRSYDLPFLHWLSWSGREVDFLAQRDIERAKNASRLARTYDLIVFPGHHEYVTEREYDLIERYRELGGNLMFLSANNFFTQVIREKSQLIRKKKMWRRAGPARGGADRRPVSGQRRWQHPPTALDSSSRSRRSVDLRRHGLAPR